MPATGWPAIAPFSGRRNPRRLIQTKLKASGACPSLIGLLVLILRRMLESFNLMYLQNTHPLNQVTPQWAQIHRHPITYFLHEPPDLTDKLGKEYPAIYACLVRITQFLEC